MQKDDYWFPAKRYGWGWGLPLKWQGWLVYGVTFTFLVAVFFIFPPATHLALFMASTWGIVIVLVAVCWLKGEPPSWRWGK